MGADVVVVVMWIMWGSGWTRKMRLPVLRAEPGRGRERERERERERDRAACIVLSPSI